MEAVFDDHGQEVETAPRQAVDLGHYMMLADDRLNVFSIFDDLKYDRADADILSPGMRSHAIDRLKQLGFKQKTGSILHNKADDIFCYIPKPQVLGASPFDVTRYTPKRREDYYILTPTQTACQFIDNYPYETALEKTVTLVRKQPINLYRLMDYLERKPEHEAFREALGQVKSVQREAVASEPLCRRRAL